MNITTRVPTALLPLALGLGLALADTTPALAQERELELGAFVGRAAPIDRPPARLAVWQDGGSPIVVRNPRLESALTLGAHAGLRLAERWGVGLALGWTPTTLAATHIPTEPGEVEVSALSYELTFLHHWVDHDRVQPFVGVGLGGETASYDREGWDARSDVGFSLLAGTDLPVADALSLRLGARHNVTAFESMVDGEESRMVNRFVLSAGLTFRRGM